MMKTSTVVGSGSAALLANKALSKQFAAILFASVCGVLATGTAASAATLQITSAGIYSDNTLIVGGNEVVASAIGLTAQGSGNLFWAFCVDLTHDISLNIGSQFTFNTPITYNSALITTNFNPSPTPLTTAQQQQIQYLASFGIGLAQSAGNPATWNQTITDALTAVQGAIWDIEYDTTITSNNKPEIITLLAQYVSDAEAYVAEHPDAPLLEGLVSPEGAQALAISAVPEPSTWAMMILGFGGIAFVAYRRKAKSGALVLRTGV
jgi:hypothetical protein